MLWSYKHRFTPTSRRLGCLILCLLVLFSSSVDAARDKKQKRKSEKQKPKITEFKIEGNKTIKDDEIFSRIQTGMPPGFSFSRKPRYDEQSFETDLQRIEALYRSKGYFDARVSPQDPRSAVTIEQYGWKRLFKRIFPKSSVKPKERAKISLTINEGKPVLIEEIEIYFPEGHENKELEDFVLGREKGYPLPDDSMLRKGDAFNQEIYQGARQEFLARIVSRGYAKANVQGSVQVDKDQRKAYVKFEIEPGPYCRFGEYHFIGLKRLDPMDLTKYLAFSPGEPFTAQKVTATQKNLFDTGSFGAVNVEPDFTSEGDLVDVYIRLEEVKRHRKQLGFGTGVDADGRFNVTGKAAWMDRSVKNSLSKVQVSGSGGAAITFTQEDEEQILGTPSAAPVFNTAGTFTLPSVGSPRRSFAASTGFSFEPSPVSDSFAIATAPFHVQFDKDLLGELKDKAIKEGRLDGPSKDSAKAFSYGYGYTFQFVGVCFFPVIGKFTDPGTNQEETEFCGLQSTEGSVEDAELQVLGIKDGKRVFRLGYLEQYLLYNKTDDPSNPRKGYALSLNIHEGAGLLAFQFREEKDIPDPNTGELVDTGGPGEKELSLGAGFNYLRFLSEFRGYTPLNEKRTIVWANRFQFGLLLINNEKDGDANTSPFPERFFLGGANSHRGFGFQGLSPTEVFNVQGREVDVPIGGNSLVMYSTELRFEAPFGLRVVTFFDLGATPQFAQVLSLDNLFTGLGQGTHPSDETAQRLRPALGIGFRYVYGPLVFRVDIATLAEQGSIDELFDGQFTIDGSTLDNLRFQISVGEAF